MANEYWMLKRIERRLEELYRLLDERLPKPSEPEDAKPSFTDERYNPRLLASDRRTQL